MQSPDELLGVEEGADDEAVEAAYRRLVNRRVDQGETAVRTLLELRNAYESLVTTPASRIATRDQASAQDAPSKPSTVRYLDYAVVSDRGWDIDDADLFEKAAAADLEPPAFGTFEADPDATLLDAAEACGLRWPYACRGGACVHCTVYVRRGRLAPSSTTLFPGDITDRGLRLSCVATPATPSLEVVYNVMHLPELVSYLGPPVEEPPSGE